jgi:photosystem II stability/assembly factor-like uncharacterized protein
MTQGQRWVPRSPRSRSLTRLAAAGLVAWVLVAAVDTAVAIESADSRPGPIEVARTGPPPPSIPWAVSEPLTPLQARPGAPPPGLPRAGATPAADSVQPVLVAGDRLTTLVPTHPDSSVAYARGERGLYRSDDGGEGWSSAGPVPPASTVVAADDPPLLLAGRRLNCARGDQAAALSRSDDGGASWRTVRDGAGIWPLAIWADLRVALGGSCGGVLLSHDAGVTWDRAPLADLGADVTAFAPLPAGAASAPGALIATTSEGGMSTLRRIDLADPARPRVGEVLLAYWGRGAVAGNGRLYLLGTATGVWVSTDQGATWAPSRTGLEDVTLSVDPLRELIPPEEQRRGFGIAAVAIDADVPDRLYVGTVDGLYSSRDAGATWQRVVDLEGLVSRIVVASAADRLLAETDASVVALAPAGHNAALRQHSRAEAPRLGRVRLEARRFAKTRI